MRSRTHSSHHGISWAYLLCISCFAVTAVIMDSSGIIDDTSTVLVRESLRGFCLMDLLIVGVISGLDHRFRFRLLFWVIVLSVNMVAEPVAHGSPDSPKTTAHKVINADPYITTRALLEISGTSSIALYLNGCAASALKTVFYPTSKTDKRFQIRTEIKLSLPQS